MYPKHNLTKREIAFSNSLKKNQDLVIRAADKGEGAVIQNYSEYYMEAQISSQIITITPKF